MLKKIIYLSFVLPLISCSSNTALSLTVENRNNLTYFIETKNISAVKNVNQYFIQTQDWIHANKAYNFLCLNDLDTELYCRLMWISALKTKNELIIFDAAAINFSHHESLYWLNQLTKVAHSQKQKLILKLLQNKLLSDEEIQYLNTSKPHYAKALFLKGKITSDLPALIEAAYIFKSLQHWELAADAFVVGSNIALNHKSNEKAQYYYHEALILYDLSQSKQKIKALLTWGNINGISR